MVPVSSAWRPVKRYAINCESHPGAIDCTGFLARAPRNRLFSTEYVDTTAGRPEWATGRRTFLPAVVLRPFRGRAMSTMQQPDVSVILTPVAASEVRKFMEAEEVTTEKGGLRVSVMPGGCSGFKYGLVIEDEAAEDDISVEAEGIRIFVDPFSAQYLSGTTIDYVSSMQGSGFTFNNPNSSGGCGCGSSFSA